ncbi:MAG: hypothetical protein H7A43_04480 [Verrucomicrobia bacterium]|nr:hypothetical protein [Verrucomicrobiota bacterium]
MKMITLAAFALITGAVLVSTAHSGEQETRIIWAAFTMEPSQVEPARIIIGKCNKEMVDRITTGDNQADFIQIDFTDSFPLTDGIPTTDQLQTLTKELIQVSKNPSGSQTLHPPIYIRTRDIIQVTIISEMIFLQ